MQSSAVRVAPSHVQKYCPGSLFSKFPTAIKQQRQADALASILYLQYPFSFSNGEATGNLAKGSNESHNVLT